MKRNKTILAASICFLVYSLGGCSCIEQIDGAEFEELAKRIEVPESVYSHQIIGTTDKRIYLEQWSSTNYFCPANTKVFWTSLTELSAEGIKLLHATRKNSKPNQQRAGTNKSP